MRPRPQGRTAYLQWREDLKRQHAATATRLMAEAGYPPEACKRVETLILKRALKELEGQIVEDALCLGGCWVGASSLVQQVRGSALRCTPGSSTLGSGFDAEWDS